MTAAGIDSIAFYRPSYPRFSDGEYQRRYRLVREQMARHGVDCLVVTGSPAMNAELMADVHWLSNWNHTGGPGFVVFPHQGEPTLYCGLFTYRTNALQRSVIGDVRPGADFARRLQELGLARGVIGLVGSIPHDVLDAAREQLPLAKLQSANDWWGELRRVRSEEEVQWLRRGAEVTDLAMEAMVRAVRPGVTERQLYARAMSAALEAGGEFCFQWLGSTPMAEPRMVYPSQVASDRVMEVGDIVIAELAASYQWMAGQLNRYVAVGRQPPSEYLELHQLTVDVCEEMCRLLKPGATPAKVAGAAAPLVEAGYRIDFLAIGRPTGPSTPPVLPKTPPLAAFQRPFLENETVMLLPMPYREPDGLGLFLGDLVLVTKDGAERLHRYPLREFRVV